MRPGQLIEYWSRRPLEILDFLHMVEENYRFEEGTLDELKSWLYASLGLRPFIIDWRQSDIELGYIPRERINSTPIEYLVYLPRNTIESYISGLEDWYLYRRIPSDMLDSEREGIIRLMTDLGWNALTAYLNDDGETGLEIEYEYTASSFLDDYVYIQLVYIGPKNYPNSA